MGILKTAKLSKAKAKLPQWALPVAVQKVAGEGEAKTARKPATYSPAAPQPLPWRRRVAGWPEAWRDRWGHRANALEDLGLGWREAEERAWSEVLKEKRDEERAEKRAAVAKATQGTFKESA